MHPDVNAGTGAAATRPGEETGRGRDLLSRYESIRLTTEKLTRGLSPEDCTVQSMPDASPTKWHMAHTSWFFETFILGTELEGYRPFMAEMRVLFNSYYNTIGAQHPRPERGLVTRPGLDDVRRYRAHVDEHMRALLTSGVEPHSRLADVIEIGLQHEQQHQELLVMDLKHLLSRNPLFPAYRSTPEADTTDPGPQSWLGYPGGEREIGYAGYGFSFDNERPRHVERLEPFELASRPVTVGEYLEFIEEGGYRQPRLWLADGWDTVAREGWAAPAYWIERDGERRLFTLAGLRPLRHEEPVCHVSYYEADAFARWSGARLPTEAEWESVAAGEPVEGNLMGSGRLHPQPRPAGSSRHAPSQLYGDVWEWTQSPYVGYPGYRPPEGALGEYNGKFMCNQFVLKGGCCATPEAHVRATYRNFFYPHQRWQFAGIRLARDIR